MAVTVKPGNLFGYPIHPVTMEEGLSVVESSLAEKTPLHVVTLNPEMLMQAEGDAELSGILKRSRLCLPDGAGVVWALRRKGLSSVRRLPGIEFSERVLAYAAEKGLGVALIGAKPEVLAQTVENLQARFAGLRIVYSHHGYFESSEAIARECAAAEPSIVLVALGVPKQEKWIAEFGPLFGGAVMIGVGGSLDVWSGMTKRAPELFRKMNLEWLYRISSEPWRLKRIYRTLPLFVIKVIMSEAGSS